MPSGTASSITASFFSSASSFFFSSAALLLPLLLFSNLKGESASSCSQAGSCTLLLQSGVLSAGGGTPADSLVMWGWLGLYRSELSENWRLPETGLM